MNLSISKDESVFHLTNDELKIKIERRNSIQSPVKTSYIIKNPVTLNKCVTKLNLKKLKQSMRAGDKAIIKEYLHSHKFDIERKKTKKITVKPMRRVQKSFIANKKENECVSMIYYPNDKRTKKLREEIDNLEKKPNLNKVENSIINKINNMKFNYQNEDDALNFDNSSKIKANNNNITINNNSFRSYNGNKNNNSNLNINFAFNNNSNKNFYIRTNSINSNPNKISNININSNITSNHRSSIFGRHNISSGNNVSHLINFHRGESEQIHTNTDQLIPEADKTHTKLSDISKNKYNKAKASSMSINYILKEKNRNLYRSNPLYDSFDDEESDKDENYNENIILPTSKIIIILDFFLFLFSIYSLFYIPLTMAKTDCFCGKENKTHKALLYFTDILYIFDFCISFFRAYYNYQLKLVKHNVKILIHYLKSDFFLDFMQAIPIFTYSNFLCSKDKEVNYCFRYSMSNSLLTLKILTNLKIFKILKVRDRQKNIILNYLFNIISESYTLEKFIENLMSIGPCLLAFHFFICLNIFLAKQTYPNWLVTNNMQDNNFLYNYITSGYSLIETLTTVGYGDLVCQSSIERIFQIFFLAIGVVAYSYLISSFGNLIKNERQSSIKYNNNMKILEEIRIDYPNMPFKLYNKIYNYIESRNIAEKKFDSNELTNSLPYNLRNALLLVMYDSCIRNFKLFKGCDNSNFIIQILSKFVPSTSKKSEIIVYEGETIEEIVIVKDGRLSLEAAIDIEDPESSIKKYFNVNFEGITTDKEMKKKLEKNKDSNVVLIQNKNTKDFDKAKNALTCVVKKQANFLLNDVCEDNSILERNENKKETENEKKTNNKSGSDYLKNEPIRNEKGNYKYIKIIDIRKNENFGGLYMFMRRPSPLSLKVKSKFAELYLIPKKDIFEIAKNYSNIWNKIHKKDFHNMLSIKHKTFNILNKYIEINGIDNINPNDVSKFIYAWEDNNNKKNKNEKKKENSKDKKAIKKDIGENNKNKNFYHSPINTKVPKNPNISGVSKSNQDLLKYNQMRDFFSNKTLDTNNLNQNNIITQQGNNELDFSQLLALAANGKQNIINTNSNLNSNYIFTMKNNNINSNIKSANKFTSNFNLNNITSNNVNTNTNANNNQQNEIKESSNSLNSNFFNNKQKTNIVNEDGNTLIIANDEEVLAPSTLNLIFNEKKAEKIKEEMKITRKKENRRKIFHFGKKAAKLFKNYKIILIEKNKDESCIVKNNNNTNINNTNINNTNISKSIYKEDIAYSNKFNHNNILDKIPEFDSDEEYSTHQFSLSDLSKENTTSFSIESIYQNINAYTNMEYSKNKNYQQKTLDYINKLLKKKDKTKLSSSHSYNYSYSDNDDINNNNISSKINKSSSFSNSFSNNKNKSFSVDINTKNNSKKNNNILYNLLQLTENESVKNSIYNSDNLYKRKKHRNKNNKNKSNAESRCMTKENIEIPKNHGSVSLRPSSKLNNINNKNTFKSKSPKKRRKKEEKFTFKIDNSNDSKSRSNSNYDKLSNKHSKKKFSKKKTNSVFEEKKAKTMKKKGSVFMQTENANNNNIKNAKTTKNTRRKSQIDNKFNLKDNFKRKSGQSNKNTRIKLDILDEKIDNKGGIRNSLAYFAKEEKDECIII